MQCHAMPEPNQPITNMEFKFNLGLIIYLMDAILFRVEASSWRLFWIDMYN
jgi:hypothetical protein